MFYNLYLLKSEDIPKDENGIDFELIYCLESDKELSAEFEKNPNLNYYFIALQKTEQNLIIAKETLKSEWKKFSELSLTVLHITSEKKETRKAFRKLMNRSNNEFVIFKTQAVGFDKTSEKENDNAK